MRFLLCKRHFFYSIRVTVQMMLRKESVTYVCKKTTNFFTLSPTSYIKKNLKCSFQYKSKINWTKDRHNNKSVVCNKTLDGKKYRSKPSYLESKEDMGDRELEFYLGWQQNTESCWKDPAAEELLRRDYYVNHAGWSPAEYSAKFYSQDDNASVAPTRNRLPPIKRYRRHFAENQPKRDQHRPTPWKQRRRYIKFMSKKNTKTSPSSSSISSSDESCESDTKNLQSNHNPSTISYKSANVTDGHRRVYFPDSRTNIESYRRQGARIREIVEGKPCDNCPETCPGFQPHSWSAIAASVTDMGILHQIDDKLAYLVQLCSRGWCPKIDKERESAATTRSAPELAPRKTTPKFPSRERNYALRRRRRNNNGATSACAACAERRAK